MDSEQIPQPLEEAPGPADGLKTEHAPDDPVAMFKIPALATRQRVNVERMAILPCDLLIWPPLISFELDVPTPHRNTIWTFLERLTKPGASDPLFPALQRDGRPHTVRIRLQSPLDDRPGIGAECLPSHVP